MRARTYKKYLVVGAALFLIVSLPGLMIEGLRTRFIASLNFPLKRFERLRPAQDYESARLEGENHLLRIEIGKLRALLEQGAYIENLNGELKTCSLSPRRYDELNFLLGLQSQAVAARVIYRDPVSFSSSMWVNVGERTNQQLKRTVIQKNSPVVVGRSVVGVVDFVGKKQSRVRLVSDVALKPSVRAVRGYPQNIALVESIDPILRHLYTRKDLPLAAEETQRLIRSLELLKDNLRETKEEWYLAKGILQGSGTPLWRRACCTLRGIGFNYDFSDQEGPARELRSEQLPIIQVNDLLVTTGMDGIFPPGLRVAEVTKIYPLREGAYTYELEACPAVENLDSLTTVFILPSTGYDENDQQNAS